MSILHPGLPNGGYHSDQRDLSIGVGMYIGNEGGQIAMGTSPQAANAYVAEKIQASLKRVNVVVDTVENGFVMTINEKKFVCSEPKELGDMLIAHMVAQRVSK